MKKEADRGFDSSSSSDHIGSGQEQPASRQQIFTEAVEREGMNNERGKDLFKGVFLKNFEVDGQLSSVRMLDARFS